MPLLDAALPVRMQRIAVAALATELRPVLVAIADSGVVEFDDRGAEPTAPEQLALTVIEPDIAKLERLGRKDLLAGEEQLRYRADNVILRNDIFALAGWCPADRYTELRDRLAKFGAAVVRLPQPHGIDPPSLLREQGTMGRAFAPVVHTYGTVPYVDIDPTFPAGIAYVVMFGMMFGDAGHGLILLGFALVLRVSHWAKLAKLQAVWPFIAGAGLASIVFGALYGEFFGPTGILPVLWLAPLEDPVRLLITAVGVGALLLSLAYAMGIVNRWREGGAPIAIYASSGVAGTAVFLGLGLFAGGWYLNLGILIVSGALVAAIGLTLVAIGLFTTSGGGGAGVIQTAVQVFDLVIRLGSNLVSFARLAAFGLTHAALGLLVWNATKALWPDGFWSMIGAVAVFVIGNAVAFALEALIAGVQALRLEFYELFSRIFEIEGRPYRPWNIPTVKEQRP